MRLCGSVGAMKTDWLLNEDVDDGIIERWRSRRRVVVLTAFPFEKNFCFGRQRCDELQPFYLNFV